MILIYNQKSNLEFIVNIFTSSSRFMDIIFNIGNTISYNSNTKVLKGIINHLFMQEFKPIFFRTPPSIPLEEIFIQEQLKVSEKMQKGISMFTKDSYNSILDLLINFGISYENFESEIKDIKLQKWVKFNIVQSIIRIVFSKEKYYYFDTEEESKSIRYMIDSNEDFYNFYEHNFLNGLIYKYMIGIKQVNGDDFQKLFRKETLFEHLIAEIFFYFGHDCLIKSFVEPFKRLISNLEENSVCMSILENMKGQEKKKNDMKNEKKNQKGLNNYEIFLNEMIVNLKCTLPFVLKVMVKMIIKISQELFTMKSQNYIPAYMLLFFCFLLSEQTLKIFNLSNGNKNLLLFLQKIMLNTIYGEDFPKTDQLSLYNGMISTYHGLLNSFIRENILMIKEDSQDTKINIRNLALNNYLDIPKFLFNVDCANVIKVAPGGFSDIISFDTIK